ncbi:MAG: NAD(P)-binding domain-containing protein, partial [Chthoniobacterales bacterium]|nr:NAD(P)-binding domain-containing protein [Chthoniobacterales bacterium]
MIRGLLRAKFCAADEIIASQPIDDLRAELEEETGIRVTVSNREVIEAADIIFIGVKPTVVLPVIAESAAALDGKVVISLAAGIRLASMEALACARFLRAMTNTPSAICRAATALALGSRSTDEDVAQVRDVFSAVGVVVTVEEENIDAVTALAGSGP